MNEIIETLENFGLNEKEAKIYLTLLPLKKATAYVVSVQSGIKKSTTYNILEILVNKGFALKTPADDKNYYMAKSPKECFFAAREKLSSIEEILPDLLAMQKVDEEKTSVSYYEGINGIKESYNRIFKKVKDKEVVGFYAHGKDSPKDLVDSWDWWTAKRKEKNIQVRGITTKDTSNEEYLAGQENNLSIIKALSAEKYNSNISVEVYDKFTQIISSRNLQSILIENSDIANVLKQIFELVWKKY